MRVFAISDLHTDFEANWRDLQLCSTTEYQNDLLIVAGDIADRMDVIVKTLDYLKSIFKFVCYTPGNHELWAKRESKTSLFKLNEILSFCKTAGIYTTPHNFAGVWIVPLFSWYQTRNLSEAVKSDEMLLLWADLYFCVWNDVPGCVSDFFAEKNANLISEIYGENIITFSHFLPRFELLPDLSRIRFKALEFVSVCPQILPQIDFLGSKTHIFGHTHINCDVVIDGVRYIQNAFGYPREDRIKQKHFFKLVFDTDNFG